MSRHVKLVPSSYDECLSFVHLPFALRQHFCCSKKNYFHNCLGLEIGIGCHIIACFCIKTFGPRKQIRVEHYNTKFRYRFLCSSEWEVLSAQRVHNFFWLTCTPQSFYFRVSPPVTYAPSPTILQ